MTSIIWPQTLPSLVWDGMEGELQQGFIRTEMDAGPAKQRQRFTAVTKRISGKIIITEAQRQTLEDFYRNTIANGTLRFAMKDPQTGRTGEFRFTGTYRESGNSGGLWEVALPLERMPS